MYGDPLAVKAANEFGYLKWILTTAPGRML